MPKKSRPRLHSGRHGAAITVKVIPERGINQIENILPDGTLEISLNAENSASTVNQALVAFLGSIVQVKVNQIDIIAGESGLEKLISILGVDADTVQERIYHNLK